MAPRPPLSAAEAVGRTTAIQEPRLFGGSRYWLEQRPQEGGRTTLMQQRPGESSAAELTPGSWNLRSRVHGYGGGAWCIGPRPRSDGSAAVVVFVHDGDRCLWRLDLPEGLSSRLCEPGERAFADGLIDPWQGRWIGVMEADGRDHLVAIPLEGGEPRPLHHPADFCGYAVLSPDGTQLAWVEWQQPHMPWQRSQLWLADCPAGPDAGLQNIRMIAGAQASSPQAVSVFQPLWIQRQIQPARGGDAPTSGAELVVAIDHSGWWNLERFDGNRWWPLLPMAAEFAMPQWVYGMRTSAWDGQQLVAAACRNGRWQLGRIKLSAAPGTPPPSDGPGRRWQRLEIPFDDLAQLDAEGGQLLCVASSPLHPQGLLQVDLNSGRWEHQPTAPCPLPAEAISGPEELWFAGYADRPTQAWFYPPSEGAQPDSPLLVRLHSGPTGMARRGLNLGIQYWTSRGWGVVDVNYGGSTGFGRAYRERLDGQWGVVDVADCAAAARAVVASGRAGAGRLAIEGGSAGGFTALAALCFSDVFQAAACRYPVTTLSALVGSDHRFEARYLDGLVGPWPQAEAIYRARSPLEHCDRIRAAVILFQGGEDPVVPAEQTQRMVEALQQRGVPQEFHLYPQEGHGFRSGEVQAAVLELSERFLRRQLGLA